MDEQQLKWGELHPRDCIQVTQPIWLTARELQFIAQLYVPFLGTQAATLYWVLYGELSPTSYESEVLRLADVLAMVQMGIPDFYQARIRLEAVGLLKTYRYEDEDAVSIQYTFELQAPASPSLFFKDALLSTMLVNQVGHQRFKKLQERYVMPPIPNKGEEVTSNFQEGFQVPYNVQSYKRNVSREKMMVKDSKQQGTAKRQSTLDWNLLQNLLQSQFLRPDALTKEIRELITDFHLYYGFTEQELVQYILYAADLATGTVDGHQLYQIIIDAAQELGQKTRVALKVSSSEQSVSVNPVAQEMEKEDPASVPSSSAPTPKSNQEILAEYATTLAPFDFITSIKKQRNGYVTKSEQRLLLEIMKESTLPEAVINILVHYLLVIKNNPTLTKNLTDTIANDWAQRGVKTAPEAIELVRSREVSRKTPQSQATQKQQRSYAKTQQGRVEQVPEWAKKKNQTKEQPVDEQSLQNLQAQIAKLKTSQQ